MRNIMLVSVMAGFLLAGCAPAAEQQVTLYYYNPEVDMDASGNVACSEAGLVPVQRFLPAAFSGDALVRETVELLLGGELMAEERSEGITTEFPLVGLALTDVLLSDGVATLTFEDPSFATSGGACRVAVLWAQIEATVLQLEGVELVKYEPANLFQP